MTRLLIAVGICIVLALVGWMIAPESMTGTGGSLLLRDVLIRLNDD